MDAAAKEARARADELAREIEPFAAEADRSNEIHGGVLAALRKSGLARYTVPAEYGGIDARVDPLHITVIRERLMRVSSHADSLFALQGIGSFAISVAGTPEQREEWLPRVASVDAIAALALTEDQAGSDLKKVATSLRSQDDRIVLSGEKTWISNAGAADFYTVLCREGEGFSLALVPATEKGLATHQLEPIIAPHVLGRLTFDEVSLPQSARVGIPGEGFKHVLATLAVFRVSVAGAAVGLAETALHEAARHAGERQQFGRPLVRLGPVAGLLADSWAELEAARLLTYRAAVMARVDPLASIDHSSMAKLYATEMLSRVVDRCVQVMGRWGLVQDSPIERAYRTARPMRIYEGASEVLRLGIARRLVEEIG